MFKFRVKWQFRLVSILSLVIQVLSGAIIVTLYFMHSFITILKELISTMMKDKTLLTSFSEQRIGNSGQPVDWPGTCPQPPHNQYNRERPAPTQSHRTTTQQHNNTTIRSFKFRKWTLDVWIWSRINSSRPGLTCSALISVSVSSFCHSQFSLASTSLSLSLSAHRTGVKYCLWSGFLWREGSW